MLLVAAIGCRAMQGSLADPPGTVYSHFLEQNYVFVPKEPPRLKYEAQLNPNIALAQTILEANKRVGSDTEPTWHGASSLMLTPAFVIRQLDDSSAAVRTPTFNPRLQFQYLWVRKTLDPGVSGVHAKDPRKWKHVDAPIIDVMFAHYSNGQAGCFYEGQQFQRSESDGDFHCVWPSGMEPASKKINESDGSFSTWFLRGGAGYQRMWVDGPRAGTPIKGRIGMLVSYRYHFPFLTEDPQAPLYGDHRWRVDLEAELHRYDCLAGAWRFAVVGERANAAHDYPRNRLSLELSRSLTSLYGLGAFARIHRGQDYYNISFSHRLNVLQWGLYFDLDRPDRFSP